MSTSFGSGHIRQGLPGFDLFLTIGGDSVKGTFNGLLAIVSAVIAGICYALFYRGNQSLYLILAIVFAILFVVFGGLFLSGRVNKTEDIHITE
jgi:membrane protease YdiL (CAAX protease family)